MRIDRIKACMEQWGLSQSELARQVGVTQGAIQQILSGSTQRSRSLPDIARVLQVSVPFLLGESDAPYEHHDPDSDPLLKDVRITSIRRDGLSTWGLNPSASLEGDWEWIHFDTELLSDFTESPASKLLFIEDLDDSMSPTLHPDDQILVDLDQTGIYEQDKIWLLNVSGINVLRRVRRLPGGIFQIMSDNPLIASYELHEGDMTVNGKAIWVGWRLK